MATTKPPVRRTLIKDVVGQCKRPCDPIPDRAFGSTIDRDEEGAAAVVNSWHVSVPSKSVANSISFVETNKRALQAGNLNSKQVRNFQKSHVIRPKKIDSQGKPRGTVLDDEKFKTMVFGQATEPSEAELSALIRGGYTSYKNDNADYPDVTYQTKKKLPKPRQTKKSEASTLARQAAKNATTSEPFKLKKFQNVQAKTGQTGAKA